MKFQMTHNIFGSCAETFTEHTAPDWLTGNKAIRHSTMDNRWFWETYVVTLPVGGSVRTEFNTITRVE